MAKPDKPVDWYPSSPWALLVVLAAIVVGMIYAYFGHWRRAALMVAGALMLGAGLRLVLPREWAGLLVVRRRTLDVTTMSLMGIAIAVVAFVVPPTR